VATRHPEQVEEIEGICRRLGIDWAELADAAALNRETMRKYANGYQPIAPSVMRALRLVEENRILRERDAAPPELAQAYSLMDTPILVQHFVGLVNEKLGAASYDWPRVIPNLRAMLDDLAARTRPGHPSSAASSQPAHSPDPATSPAVTAEASPGLAEPRQVAEAALVEKAVAEAQRPRVVFPRKRKK
jgi:hypothetical protein